MLFSLCSHSRSSIVYVPRPQQPVLILIILYKLNINIALLKKILIASNKSRKILSSFFWIAVILNLFVRVLYPVPLLGLLYTVRKST